MPPTKSQSPLMRRLGKRLDDAVRNAAGKAPALGNQPLPPGIQNGIAQLDTIEFAQVAVGKQNAGEFYCRMVATVCEPEYHTLPNGQQVHVAGRKTSIIIMLCDTKNSKGEVTPLQANVETLEAHMKLMGVPAEHFDGGGEALESAAAMLVEAKPYIVFSTSAGKPTPQYPTPRTFENWYGSKGIPDDYSPPAGAGGALQDDTGAAAPSANGAPHDDVDPSNADGAMDDVASDDAPDLDALAELADRTKVVKGKQVPDGDVAAQEQLDALAAEAGVADEAAQAASYADVVELIRGAQDGGNDAPADEPIAWAKGDVAVCQLPDPKNPKKQKAQQVEVTLVNKLKRLADVKVLAGGKVFKAVSWDDLAAA